MFIPYNSNNLMAFYKGLYSSSKNDKHRRNKTTVPFSEESRGKFWLELPSQMDKRLKEMKKKFYQEFISSDPEKILILSNQMAMNCNNHEMDSKQFDLFSKEFFIGMNRKYEFQETMVVHSLVRALQMSRGRCLLMPETEEMLDLKEEEIDLLEGNLKEEYKTNFSLEERKNWVKEKMMSMRMDTLGFTNFILNRGKDNNISSSIGLYSGLNTIVSHHYKMQNKLEEMNLVYKFHHPVMRTIRFYLSDIGVSVEPKDLINYIFNPNKDFTNSVQILFLELLGKQNEMSMNQVFDNPFKFIQILMVNSRFPFKDFKDYLMLNQKSMKFVKVNMMSDLFDSGNYEDNLLNLYSTRTNPSYSYERRENMRMSDPNVLEFLTNTSMRNRVEYHLGQDMTFFLTNQDTKVKRAMTLDKISGEDWVDTNMLDYRRVEYKKMKLKNIQMEMWSNVNTLIKVIHRKAHLDVFISSRSTLESREENRLLMSMFLKDMYKYLNEGYQVLYRYNQNSSELYGVSYRVCNMRFKTKVNYKNTKWIMMLYVSSNIKMEGETETFSLMVDNYTVDSESLKNYKLKNTEDELITIRNLMDEPKDIKTLELLLLENEMLVEVSLSETEDSNQRYDINNINQMFGVINLENTLGKMLNIKMDEMSSSEDSDNIEMDEFRFGETMSMEDMIKMSSLLREDQSDSSKMSESQNHSNMIKVLDYLVSSSFLGEVTVDKRLMMDIYKFSVKNNKTLNFHNLLLWQLRNLFDHNISNIMSLIMYNIVLKNFFSELNVSPTSNLRLLPKDMKVDSKTLFIKKKEDLSSTFENLLSF
jgi:hypothetical protein